MTHKFEVILDMNHPDFANQLRNAIGLKEGETLEIITPQFDRVDGRVITYFPRTVTEFDAIKKLDDHALQAIGCGLWCKGHYLYPKEWYWNIPNGYIVTSISDDDEPFIPGKTDGDHRFGCLSYGFKVGDTK